MQNLLCNSYDISILIWKESFWFYLEDVTHFGRMAYVYKLLLLSFISYFNETDVRMISISVLSHPLYTLDSHQSWVITIVFKMIRRFASHLARYWWKDKLYIKKTMHYYEKDEDPDGFYNTPAHTIREAINRGVVKGPRVGEEQFEYVYEENSLGHSPSSDFTRDVYVLPPQDRKNVPTIQEPTIRTHTKKTATISDIYDEDHYTLARNSWILTNRPSVFQVDADQKSEDATNNEKNKKGIFSCKDLAIVALIFGSFATGGFCAYIVMSRQGSDNWNCLLKFFIPSI